MMARFARRSEPPSYVVRRPSPSSHRQLLRSDSEDPPLEAWPPKLIMKDKHARRRTQRPPSSRPSSVGGGSSEGVEGFAGTPTLGLGITRRSTRIRPPRCVAKREA